MYEVKGLDHVNTKVDALIQKIENLTITLATPIAIVTLFCEIYGVQGHVTSDCQLLYESSHDQENYVQGNLYSNTYNPRWINHMNFSYKNNNVLFQPSPHPHTPHCFQNNKGSPTASSAPKKSNLEFMMENFVTSQSQKTRSL